MKPNIAKLIAKYEGLKADHFFESGGVQMIRRPGIEAIEAAESILIKIECPQAGKDFAVIVATGWHASDPVGSGASTSASASALTCVQGQYHYAEIAEARARARVVLKMAGLYKEEIFFEGEIVEEVKKTPTEVAKAKLEPKEKDARRMAFVKTFYEVDGVNLQGKVLEVHSEADGLVTTTLHVIPADKCHVWAVAEFPYLSDDRKGPENSKLLAALVKRGITDATFPKSLYAEAPHLFKDAAGKQQNFASLKEFLEKATVSNILTLITNHKK